VGREQGNYPKRSRIARRAILVSFQATDSAMADPAHMIALWPTRSANRENLVKQQTMLVEIHDTIRQTSELILGSHQLIRQLDWMSDAAWHRNENPYPQKEKV
jgi:hypothetical protein